MADIIPAASGRLLFRIGDSVETRSGDDFDTAKLLSQAGFEVEPLYVSPSKRATIERSEVDISTRAEWYIASSTKSRLQKKTRGEAWDEAHNAVDKMESGRERVRSTEESRFYVEPELFHGMYNGSISFGEEARALRNSDDYPKPAKPHPFWHLESGFTELRDAQKLTLGEGVRIFHLDTGYSIHISVPTRLNNDIDYDFYRNDTDPKDDKDTGGLANPGHGTSTIALLAGREVVINAGGAEYRGYVGGAPSAEIVELRIAPSVVLILTAAFAKALFYASENAPSKATTGNVLSMSMGGLPSRLWADAVNFAYDQGILMVTAAGNNIRGPWGTPIVTRNVVYPARFDRVLCVAGATYEQTPYSTGKTGTTQGNYGPLEVMNHALAAYTPNTVSAEIDQIADNAFKFDFGGTSSATPQVAAAAALFMSKYGDDLKKVFPDDPWKRIEVCRFALYSSAKPGKLPAGAPATDQLLKFGRGIVQANKCLDAIAYKVAVSAVKAGTVPKAPQARVRFAFWRVLFGWDEPRNERERMYEMELEQALVGAGSDEAMARLDSPHDNVQLASAVAREVKDWVLKATDISQNLRNFINNKSLVKPSK